MSTCQQNQSTSYSPILLSPSSTSHATIINHHHLPIYDNSDQGSVDSDYTSLSSSKFYGHGGSTSSLYRQGRSQSIDELASTTTTIPTRHFNGILNVNKSTNDPLQFVKIHPNHDLIERAQEQLTLAESRKRLQDNLKLTTQINTNKIQQDDDDDDEQMDWSKVIDQKSIEKNRNKLDSRYDCENFLTMIFIIERFHPENRLLQSTVHRTETNQLLVVSCCHCSFSPSYCFVIIE
jgi:hypothetical protein